MKLQCALLASLALGCSSTPSPTSPPTEGASEAHDHDHPDGGHDQANDPTADHRHGEGMPHRFEDAQAWAKQFDSPQRAAWQKPDEVVAALKLASDAKVADIGAGTGYFSMRFARVVPQGRVFAGDIEPDMVRYLEERADKEKFANVTAVLGTPEDPSLPESVDVVFLCNVYHHVGNRKAYFANVRTKLAAGGRLVIVDFRSDAPEDAPGPPREHRVSQDDVVQELAAAGFALSRADRDLLPYQYILEFEASPT